MSQPVDSAAPTPSAAPAYQKVNYLNADAGVMSWLKTLDHKRIGIMYFSSVLVTFLLGGIFAMIVRFELLTPDGQAVPPAMQARLCRLMARAAGSEGMAGGQAIDLASVGRTLGAAEVENMHRRKTGALIEASVLMGAAAACAGNETQSEALKRYGTDIGLAFQIQDDILDVEGDAALLGKSTGADAARCKPTYPSTAGLAASRQRALELRDSAVAALAPLGERGRRLADLAHYIVSRAQ